jgi:hypothetical protein
MVGRETTFVLPSGRWWVYLFGVYVKDKKPQGNFLNEKSVRVPRNQPIVAEFNLIPEETSVMVRVMAGGQPVYGVAVWVDGNEHKLLYTNKAAGGLLLFVPRGAHVITVKHEGRQLDQQILVSSTLPMETVIDITSLQQAMPPAQDALPQATPRQPAPLDLAATQSAPGVAAIMERNMFDLEVQAAGPASDAVSTSSLAQVNVARYELRTEIGRGAMGVVFEAWDTVLERSVALKVISQELKNRPDVVELFMREARSLAQLNHPNIVTVYDFGQRGADYFMALELISGKTLEQLLSEQVGGTMPLLLALDIALEVCAGLSYAHEQRVIHRDVKPANIFVLGDGRAKIMDFGLARVVRELSIKRTMISGTPLYMSPEQIRGTDLDFRADLYSLGCMVYELVCGTPPFFEGEVLYHHSHTRPDPPSRRSPALPHDIDPILLRSLEKDKEARYASVAEFASALRELKARLGQRQSA